jgi:ABC-2 type transport system ATP-binding protein
LNAGVAAVAPAILVRDLRKSYGAFEAVRGIDFEVAPGEVFGLLGPNGAGKTTTVEILEGYRRRDAGIVSVLGQDPERRPRDLRTLSGGQMRRLDFGLALVGDPELIFLDEPTTGFDPAARRAAWDVVRSLQELGKTVLLTTHYLDEAQALCDRVAIVKEGRIVAEGPPAELGASSSRYTVAWRSAETGALESRETEDPTALLHQLTSAALARGEAVRDLSVGRPSLEDVYLELTTEPTGEHTNV